MDEAEGGTKEFFERHPRSEARRDLEDALAGLVEFVLTYALVFVAVGTLLWNCTNGIESWGKVNHQIFLFFANDSTAALVALPAALVFVWLLFRLIDFKVQGLVNFIDAQILAVADRWRKLAKTRPSALLTGTLARFSDRWHRHIQNRKTYAEKQKARKRFTDPCSWGMSSGTECCAWRRHRNGRSALRHGARAARVRATSVEVGSTRRRVFSGGRGT